MSLLHAGKDTPVHQQFVSVVAIVVAGCLLCVPSVVTAQTIRGQVMDSISGLPVGAGFVVLLGEDGEELARSLTTGEGRFEISLNDSRIDRFRLRSERIGYRVSITALFERSVRDLEGVTLYVTALPAQLAAIEARDRSECRIRPSAGERTAVVWEEARKALAASSWTASRQAYNVVSNISTLDTDGRQRNVSAESHRPFIGLTTSPFVSRAPEELVQTGYLTRDAGSYVYTSPDAHVFQSDGFLDTHCFRLTGESDTLIGLAFEPVPSRDLPDVKGVLWIDRISWELRLLEYEYVNLPEDVQSGEPAHGSVEFLPLPSGAWIVNRWAISFPTAFREERVGEFDRRARRRTEASRTVGGEILEITERTGALVYETEFAEVVGAVIDSSTDGWTLPRAVVAVENTWFADTTDEHGRFHLRVPLSGEYAVTVSSPRLDSLVFGPAPVRLRLNRGEFVDTTIVIRPLPELFTAVCPDRPPGAINRILVGKVTDEATRTPVYNASVVAQWQHITPQIQAYNRHTVATTDERGRFALCGLEVGRPALVYAVSSTGRSALLRVGFEPTHIEMGGVGAGVNDAEVYATTQPVWRRDLTIGHELQRNTLVAGVVTDALSLAPISGVEIRNVNRDVIAVTDATGLFSVEGINPGVHHVSLNRFGYASRAGEIRVHDDQVTFVESRDLALTPVPQISGVVREEGTLRPLPLAWITLVNQVGDSLVRARTDSSGAFMLTAPGDGLYSVAIRRLGFAPDSAGPFRLRAGMSVETEVELTPGVFALDPILVTAEAPERYLSQVGFFDRQRANRGYFMGPADIEARLGASPDVFQLLAALPGVGVADAPPGQTGSRIILNRGRFSQIGCGHGPVIFVDGFRLQHGEFGGSQPDFDAVGMAVQPEEVQAIEVYRTPSQIPIQYSGTQSACGVILIWTWRGRN